MPTIGTPGAAAAKASTMACTRCLSPGRRSVTHEVGIRPLGPKHSTYDVVRADVDRDERDLPDMRFQEADRRVQL